jgi:restriction endonuclease S subunit
LLTRGELEKRLDPFYYMPNFTQAMSKIKSGIKVYALAQFIIHPPEYPREYSDNGYQLIRSQNVRPTGIDLSANPVFLSEYFLVGKKFTTAKKNDLLIVRSGVNAGDIATVEQDYDNAIIGADTLLARFSDEIYSKIVQIFFWTDLGRLLLSRYITGATNRHISPENFGQITIPATEGIVQGQIVDLFQQALSRKRGQETEAQALLDSIDGYLLAALGVTLPPAPDNTIQNRLFRIGRQQLSGGRFDPTFHQGSIYGAIINTLFDLVALRRSIHYFQNGFAAGRGNQNLEGKGIIQIRPTNMDSQSRAFIFDKNVHISPADSEDYTRDLLIPGEVLFNNTNSQELVGKTIYFDLDGAYFCSNHLTRIRPKETLNGEYLAHLLNLYQRQGVFFKSCINWNNQSGINIDILRGILIPVPPMPVQTEIVETINARRQQAQALRVQAGREFAEAKATIERLILGG